MWQAVRHDCAEATKPLTRGGRVFFWFMIVFIVLIGLGGGGSLIKDGLDGRAALADGASGTFAPTDRDCGKDGCTWISDFVSHEGTITRTLSGGIILLVLCLTMPVFLIRMVRRHQRQTHPR